MINVKDMKVGAQRRLFESIVAAVLLLDDERFEEFLTRVIDQMNELDQDDFFCTEGWRHYVGDE